MGRLGYGYGSEFHLLRFMGRHRTYFENEIKKVIGLSTEMQICWKDFEMGKSSPPMISDRELRGLDFLSDGDKTIDEYRSKWPQTGNSMNWDAIAYYEDNGKKVWILIEAKAHKSELKGNTCKAGEKSLDEIKKALNNTKDSLCIDQNTDWLNKYYQMANRIYICNLINKNSFDKAILLDIYFCGDCFKDSPLSKDEWQGPLNEMKKQLGIINKEKDISLYELFIPLTFTK